MTYKELLEIVPFEDIAPYVNYAASYKIHYDMLKTLPLSSSENEEEEEYEKYITITAETEVNPDIKVGLYASNLEGDIWESSLAKEIKIEPDVKASLAEIAVCCLWHSSYYGFTQRQRDARFEEITSEVSKRDLSVLKSKEIQRKLKARGVSLPSIHDLWGKSPSFRKEVKMVEYHKNSRVDRRWHYPFRTCFRRFRVSKYAERMREIGEFILEVYPDDKVQTGISLKALCSFARADKYKIFTCQSYSGDVKKRADWFVELIEKYHALEGIDINNMVLSLAYSPQYPMGDSEVDLINFIREKHDGYFDLILREDETLGVEIRLAILFYEKYYPIRSII